jgi:hypothetical protein
VDAPTTNAEYLAAIFAGLPPGLTPWVCSFDAYPGNWAGRPWTPGTAIDGIGANAFYTLATYRPDAYGIYSRKSALCATVYGVMLDDIGTKVDAPALNRLAPSIVNRTSNGNHQVVYLFREPVTDPAEADALLDALLSRRLGDTGANGASARYSRLPFGVNTKHMPPHACGLVKWHPERRYTIAEIAGAFDVQLVKPERSRRLHASRTDLWESKTEAERGTIIDDLASALQCIPADDYDLWIRVGHYLRTLPDLVGYALFELYSQKSDKCDNDGLLRFFTCNPDRVDYRSVFTLAKKYGWVNPRRVNPEEKFAAPVALPPGASPVPLPPVNAATLSFPDAAAGAIDARIERVYEALNSEAAGRRIAFDAFLEQIMIKLPGEPWRPFTDADYGRIRVDFQRRGFKAITPEVVKTAVLLTAEDHRFDSLAEFASALEWDGVPRIDTALPAYFGTKDTPYTRAVGAYIFTAFAARALQPGAQVDMVPVFVGLQGERKSSAVRALAPDPDFYCEVNLKRIDDDNTSRLIRGICVGEIAELRGLAGRDQESVKAFLTRRIERWIPKYREFMTTYPRRLVFIGTANEREFLDDPSGERRWLPVEAGKVNVEAIERDRLQLWAEGVARFKANGIEWLAEPSMACPLPNGATPFKIAAASLGALGRDFMTLTRTDQLRLGKVLRAVGYEKTNARMQDGKVGKAWVRAVPTPPPP